MKKRTVTSFALTKGLAAQLKAVAHDRSKKEKRRVSMGEVIRDFCAVGVITRR